jgi:SH3-like domain-containing protein
MTNSATVRASKLSTAKRVVVSSFVAILATAVSVASAAEYKSVAINAAVLYDGPSAKAKRIFLAPRGMPLEVISVVEPFVKVRDAAGDFAWVDRRALGSVRMLVATTTAPLRATGEDSATATVQVERGVLLELIEAGSNGWVRVKHSDGASGFVKSSEVWGL